MDEIVQGFIKNDASLRFTLAMGDKTVLTLFDPSYIRSQKATIQYDDRMDQALVNNLVLTHTTSLKNWEKIKTNGAILGRNQQADPNNSLFTPGQDSDGDIVYCEVHYKGEVLPPSDPNKVTIVLDPKLLQRKDYYACQSWCYGPFNPTHKLKRYFGPEIRDLKGFDTIPKEDVM